MQCNIDARGKAARLQAGIVATLLGVVLAVLILINVIASPLAWIGVAVLLLVGGFSIFEARAGWCAVRAMGIKTRI
ncbi:MAG: hypothetical protein AAF432_12405 [Planctomycetota bacterium]